MQDEPQGGYRFLTQDEPEKLKLSRAESYLRPGVTFDTLEMIANQMSDNEFGERFAMLGRGGLIMDTLEGYLLIRARKVPLLRPVLSEVAG